MANLFGEYRHKVDAKGRLALPAKFRKELPGDLVVTVDPARGEYLLVFAEEDYSHWIESLFEAMGGYNPRSLDHQRQRTKLFGLAKAVELDGSGRINIAADLREKAGITRDVSIIGSADHFEIWDAKRWESVSEEVDLTSMFTD